MKPDSPRQDTTPMMLDKDESGQTEPETTKRTSRLRQWCAGWKFTVALASSASMFVLAFSLGFILWAVQRHQLQSNRGTLHEGACDRVKVISIVLHLVINILSTILLGASNYCMVS